MTRALKGLVYGRDFRFRPGTIFIENGMIREIREEAASPQEQEKLPSPRHQRRRYLQLSFRRAS